MTKEELILNWQQEMSYVEDSKKRTLGVDFNYETKKFLISSFLNDLKNLNGETVKFGEVCDFTVETSKYCKRDCLCRDCNLHPKQTE